MVFVSSEHPDLAAALLPCLPSDVGIVFKLSDEADLIPIESRFSVDRWTQVEKNNIASIALGWERGTPVPLMIFRTARILRAHTCT